MKKYERLVNQNSLVTEEKLKKELEELKKSWKEDCIHLESLDDKLDFGPVSDADGRPSTAPRDQVLFGEFIHLRALDIEELKSIEKKPEEKKTESDLKRMAFLEKRIENFDNNIRVIQNGSGRRVKKEIKKEIEKTNLSISKKLKRIEEIEKEIAKREKIKYESEAKKSIQSSGHPDVEQPNREVLQEQNTRFVEPVDPILQMEEDYNNSVIKQARLEIDNASTISETKEVWNSYSSIYFNPKIRNPIYQLANNKYNELTKERNARIENLQKVNSLFDSVANKIVTQFRTDIENAETIESVHLLTSHAKIAVYEEIQKAFYKNSDDNSNISLVVTDRLTQCKELLEDTARQKISSIKVATRNTDQKIEVTGSHSANQSNSTGQLLSRLSLVCNTSAANNLTESFFRAIRGGNESGFLRLLSVITKLGKINTTDKLGQTPLHYAVQRGNQVMVRLLLENGANPKIEDKTYLTPSRLTRNEKILQILETVTQKGSAEKLEGVALQSLGK